MVTCIYQPVVGESEGCGRVGVASISDRLRARASSSSSHPSSLSADELLELLSLVGSPKG